MALIEEIQALEREMRSRRQQYSDEVAQLEQYIEEHSDLLDRTQLCLNKDIVIAQLIELHPYLYYFLAEVLSRNSNNGSLLKARIQEYNAGIQDAIARGADQYLNSADQLYLYPATQVHLPPHMQNWEQLTDTLTEITRIHMLKIPDTVQGDNPEKNITILFFVSLELLKYYRYIVSEKPVVKNIIDELSEKIESAKKQLALSRANLTVSIQWLDRAEEELKTLDTFYDASVRGVATSNNPVTHNDAFKKKLNARFDNQVYRLLLEQIVMNQMNSWDFSIFNKLLLSKFSESLNPFAVLPTPAAGKYVKAPILREYFNRPDVQKMLSEHQHKVLSMHLKP